MFLDQVSEYRCAFILCSGPLLKELLSITHGHKVTRDAHELVSRVLTEYSGLEQTIEKVRGFSQLCWWPLSM